jgi:hypothetical protein
MKTMKLQSCFSVGTKYMTKFILIILASATGLLQAAQIGDEVHSNVGMDALVTVPDNVPTAITQISLDDGVWVVSGQINFYEATQPGTLYVGGNISVGSIMLTTDGLTLFNGTHFIQANALIQGLALPSRSIDINGNGVPVYLVGWSHEPSQLPLHCLAWGFVSARKIRNNH